MHKLIAKSLTSRGDANGIVNQIKLYVLFNIATRRQINVALLVAYGIRRKANDNRSTTIYLGHYIIWGELPRMTAKKGIRAWNERNITMHDGINIKRG